MTLRFHMEPRVYLDYYYANLAQTFMKYSSQGKQEAGDALFAASDFLCHFMEPL